MVQSIARVAHEHIGIVVQAILVEARDNGQSNLRDTGQRDEYHGQSSTRGLHQLSLRAQFETML